MPANDSLPRGLKPSFYKARYGAAEAAPFQGTMLETHSRTVGTGTQKLICLTAVLVAFCICSTPIQAAQSASKNTFLVASDIHFNPMADASLVPDLAAADATQWETILNRSKATAFSQYGEDTNWWLLQSSLDAMRATLPHPAFIMTNGDILAHQFPANFLKTTRDSDREDYRKFVLKTVEFLALEFRKRFPDTQILLTPGNDDDVCGNYTVEAGGRFLQDTAELASKLAHGDEEFRSSWEALGSYDMPNPAIRGVRIISLNSVFLSAKYHAAKFSEGCVPVTSTAAGELLTWLESRLNAAQQAHEKVWLMFHIPPGMDGYASISKYQTLLKGKTSQTGEKLCASAVVPMWVPKWTSQFDSLLEKFQGTVIASFAGHTHTDDFRVISSSGANPAFILISPPVSPVYKQNPAFRTITFSSDGSLSDQSVYYLTNLDYASSKTPGEWKREYTFSKEWEMKRLDAASLASLYGKVKSQQAARDEWLKLYNVSSAAAYIPADSAPGAYCAIAALDPQAYSNCYCGTTVSPTAPAPKP